MVAAPAPVGSRIDFAGTDSHTAGVKAALLPATPQRAAEDLPFENAGRPQAPTVNTNPSHLPLLLALLALASSSATAAPAAASLSRDALLDKIKGGWAGQMIGVVYGAPTEFKSNGRIGTWNLAWKPGSLASALNQDDLYVEMTFAKVMDDRGLDATTQQYGEAFRDSEYRLWHANAGARRALRMGIAAPWSGHPKYNFHANDIDFQIEADFIGLMCPALPRESNRLCDRVGHVMNYGDGVYGGMFVAGMYAAAFVESNPRRIVQAGLACLPRESEYARLIADVLRWSEESSGEWQRVWQRIEDAWTKEDACPGGFLADFNIDAKVNGAYVALGLLAGGGDFERTMEIATRCGQDSDCNPSSAAGVLGVVLGFERLPEIYRKEIPAIADRKFAFTAYSYNDIVRSTESRALNLIRKAGGSVTEKEVRIPVQSARAARLEQWNPGVPDMRIPVGDPRWEWRGAWQERAARNKPVRVSRAAGDEAILKFDGVALALTGVMNTAGGRADVYVDGKKQDLPLDAYTDERTMDNVVWQIFGLRPGAHTLRVVASETARSSSSGRELTLAEAVVFRAR
jgi:hypothetical protein